MASELTGFYDGMKKTEKRKKVLILSLTDYDNPEMALQLH